MTNKIKPEVSLAYQTETQNLINNYERWVLKILLSNDIPYSDEVNAYELLYNTIIARGGEIPSTIHESHDLFTVHYIKTVQLAQSN
jgi:hypothetical protein